jgi:hypothetical protein
MAQYEEIYAKRKDCSHLSKHIMSHMVSVFCEIAYVLSFIRTTYSRFTSTTIKRSRFFPLLRDSKGAVELAVASTRFKPSGQPIPSMEVYQEKGSFYEIF